MPPSSRLIVFRCDASPTIGMGHFMRCFALAQCWLEMGGQTVFIFAEKNDVVINLLENHGVECQVLGVDPGSQDDANRFKEVLDATAPEWIIVDGYHFKKTWFDSICTGSGKIAFWTDYVQEEGLKLDLILNQNAHASVEVCQQISSEAYVLAGLDYLVLRNEFRAKLDQRSIKSAPIRRLLVTMGGADPDNVSSTIIEFLSECAQWLEVDLVVGSNNKHIEHLRELADSKNNVILHYNVSDMTTLMESSDLAITAAGTTLWELAFMGVPALSVVLAENQLLLSEAADSLGFSKSLGWASDLNLASFSNVLHQLVDHPVKLMDMKQKALDNVDGLGAKRVCEYLLNA